MCSSAAPVRPVARIRGQIVVFDIDIPITLGYAVILHFQSINEQASISRLSALLSKSTGEIVKKNPRCLTKNCTALVEIVVSKPICLLPYRECKEFGRFMLRAGGKTIAMGIVQDIFSLEPQG